MINIIIGTLKLIPKEMRVRSFFVLFMVFLGMLIEMLGVGIFLPVLTLILNTNKLVEYPLIQDTLKIFSITTEIDLIFISLSMLFVIYLIKVIFLTWLSLLQAKFIFNLQSNISYKLFDYYINQKYSYHLKINSATLIRNVTTETNQLVESAFLPLMLIINEIIVVVGLVILMLIITTSNALILISSILVGVFILYYSTKKTLMNLGAKRQTYEGFKIKTAQEGIAGIKEIKILGRENNIITKFKYQLETLSNVAANRNAIQQLPRNWIEFLGLSALLLIIVFDLNNGKSAIEIIPNIAFIGIISFRIMPSVNRLVSAMQSLNYTSPVISLISDELLQFNTKKISKVNMAIKFDERITIQNLKFFYQDNKPIINDITLEIKKGQKLGIIGASGCGKSTFIDLILGLHKPAYGIIKVDDININEHIKSWQSILGYVPQSIFLSDDSLKSNIAFGVPDSEININDIFNAIKLAQLDDLVINLSDGIETILGERGVRISGGQRQRIGIARALYRRPKILVLDEATSALDTEVEKEVMKSIYSLDKSITIIIVAHRLSTLDGCDTIINLIDGKINDK